jgi:5-methylcytosine-specific restriction endonuclease McrA
MEPGMLRDRVEVVPCGADPAQTTIFGDISEQVSNYFRCGSESGDTYRISFAAGEEFMALLKRVQELVFSGDPEEKKLEFVLRKALELYIDRMCPRKRRERREARRERKLRAAAAAEEQSERAPEPVADNQAEPKQDKGVRKPIPQWLKDELLKEAGYMCSYEGPYGARCMAMSELEVDHIVPVAAGGGNTRDNLRVPGG